MALNVRIPDAMHLKRPQELPWDGLYPPQMHCVWENLPRPQCKWWAGGKGRVEKPQHVCLSAQDAPAIHQISGDIAGKDVVTVTAASGMEKLWPPWTLHSICENILMVFFFLSWHFIPPHVI